MLNKLYIQKNIKRNFSAYLHVMLIITISIITVNILNIYMDAVFYGDELLGNTKQSSVPTEQIILFNILTVIFAGIGAISIYFVYSMFIENRRKDIGIFIGLGMNKKQLKKLLFAELFFVYIISFFAALILSNIVMYIIIKNYLLVENENLTLIAYRFSFSRSVILLFISFHTILSSFIISLEKISKIPIIQTIQNGFADKKIKRDTDVWNKSSAVKYIYKANLTRNKKIFIICSILSVPVIIINIVFLNYMNLLNAPSVDEPDFIIDINYIEVYNYSEIILENIEFLENMDGIKNLEFVSYNNNFLMEADEFKLKFPASAVCDYSSGGLGYYHHVSIKVLDDRHFKNIENYYKENYVILSENLNSSKYIEGDKLFLHDHSKHESKNKKIFTIAGFVDFPQTGNFLNIFVTGENFEKITGYPAIPNAINIYIDNTADTAAIRDEIFSIFDNRNLFKILDNIRRIEDRAYLEKGLIITASFLCAVIFLCVVILLWSFMSFYISNQKQQINILRTIGATKKAIIKIAVNESLVRGIINALVGLALGTYISYIVAKMSGYDLIINDYILALYGLILSVTILAHFMPAFITAKRLISKK